jgi:predicted phage gp36 major capsid-like protein
MTTTPDESGELTPARLAAYLRAAVDAAMQDDIDSAAELLAPIWAQATRTVPATIRYTVWRDVAADIWRRRDNLAGNSQFADVTTGQPVRAPRDPLAASWPIIRHYVPGF